MEQVINEILVGRRVIYTDVDFAPIIVCRGLTGEEKILSGIYYKKAFEEARAMDLPTESELSSILVKNGDWTGKHEQALIDADKKVKDIAKQLPGLKYQVAQHRRLKKKMLKEKKKYDKLKTKKLLLMVNSAEHYAEEHKYYWMMHKIAFDVEGTPIWNSLEDFEAYDRDIINEIITAYSEKFNVETTEIRKIARSGLWRIYYNSCPNSKDLFNRPLSDLDNNQINLLYWSGVYDSAYKCMDTPDEETFEDDDVFDAWMEAYSEKIKKDRAKSKFDSGSSKPGLSEQFIMTDEEGAKKLYKEVR